MAFVAPVNLAPLFRGDGNKNFVKADLVKCKQIGEREALFCRAQKVQAVTNDGANMANT